MKKLIISSAIIMFGFSMNLSAQKRPTPPPHPSKTQVKKTKAQELDAKYNMEKKLIMNHPVATKKMKADQLKALNERYRNEKRLLKSAP